MVSEADVLQLLDETRALTLSLLEKLANKEQAGSFQKLLSRQDVEAILKRQGSMIEEFRKARREAASALVLPPGVKA